MTNEQNKLGQWLKGKCKEGNLSLRETAAKTGVSFTTISSIIKGGRPSPETIRKLAGGFGQGESPELENYLFGLAGYRIPHREFSEPLARLVDKVKSFTEPQLKMMLDFAHFLTDIEGDKPWRQ